MLNITFQIKCIHWGGNHICITCNSPVIGFMGRSSWQWPWMSDNKMLDCVIYWRTCVYECRPGCSSQMQPCCNPHHHSHPPTVFPAKEKKKAPEPRDAVISPVSLSLYSARHKLQDELILYYLFMDAVTQADATGRQQTRWLKGAGQAWVHAGTWLVP